MNRELLRVLGKLRHSLLLRLFLLLTLSILLTKTQGNTIAQTALEQDDLQVILADGQFVYGPNASSFNLGEFLHTQNSLLQDEVYQKVIYDQATYFGINPKVLLTLIEMQSGLVTMQSPLTSTIESPLRYPDIAGFTPQVKRVAERLNEHFYWYLYGYQQQRVPQSGTTLELTLMDGTKKQLPVSINAGTYAIQATLAEVLGNNDWSDAVSITSLQGFYHTYTKLYPQDNPLDASNTLSPNATPPSDLLKLPFTCNDTWKFFQGPHPWNGADENGNCYPPPYSSVDFGPSGFACTDPVPTNEWITAAAAGTVTSVSCNGCKVIIDHGNSWQTHYYHVINAQVSQGQQVNKDARVGNPSCRPSAHGTCGTSCGGSATAPHVHFAIYQNGYQPIDGTSLEGWIVHETGCYAGYLQKGSTIINEGGNVTSQDCNCCGCGTQMACSNINTLLTSTVLHNSSLPVVAPTLHSTISPTPPDVITPTHIPTRDYVQGYPESFSLPPISDTVSLTTQIEPQFERVYTDESFIEEEIEILPQRQNSERKLRYFPLQVNLARPASSSYYLARSVVAMGGGVKTSVSYQVLGTSGQTNDVGHLKSINYTVNSGFWPGAMSMSKSSNIYLPLVLRSG